MNARDLKTLKNDTVLVSNYFPKYIRHTNRIITGLLRPSSDILKYCIVDPSRIYTKSNVNYLDLVSFDMYENYLYTRNLYIVNNILDPVNTKIYKSFAVVNPDKLVGTINNGLLLRPETLKESLKQVSISYIYDSIYSTSYSEDSLFNAKSITTVVSHLLQEIDNTYKNNIPIEVRKNIVFRELLNVYPSNNF